MKRRDENHARGTTRFWAIAGCVMALLIVVSVGIAWLMRIPARPLFTESYRYVNENGGKVWVSSGGRYEWSDQIILEVDAQRNIVVAFCCVADETPWMQWSDTNSASFAKFDQAGNLMPLAKITIDDLARDTLVVIRVDTWKIEGRKQLWGGEAEELNEIWTRAPIEQNALLSVLKNCGITPCSCD